jgi:hypothetical protein
METLSFRRLPHGDEPRGEFLVVVPLGYSKDDVLHVNPCTWTFQALSLLLNVLYPHKSLRLTDGTTKSTMFSMTGAKKSALGPSAKYSSHPEESTTFIGDLAPAL